MADSVSQTSWSLLTVGHKHWTMVSLYVDVLSFALYRKAFDSVKTAKLR